MKRVLGASEHRLRVLTVVHREACSPGYTYQRYTGRHIGRGIPTIYTREAYRKGYPYTPREAIYPGYTPIYTPREAIYQVIPILHTQGGYIPRLYTSSHTQGGYNPGIHHCSAQRGACYGPTPIGRHLEVPSSRCCFCRIWEIKSENGRVMAGTGARSRVCEVVTQLRVNVSYPASMSVSPFLSRNAPFPLAGEPLPPPVSLLDLPPRVDILHRLCRSGPRSRGG